MKELSIEDMLQRNGVIEERARRDGRSLDRIERSIILAAREKAIEAGAGRHTINTQEMLGERDFNRVFAKIKVVAVLSYWDDMGLSMGMDPTPQFIVRDSNHPGLVVGGHVSLEQFEEAGLKPPKFMTYKKWVKKGRNVIRK